MNKIYLLLIMLFSGHFVSGQVTNSPWGYGTEPGDIYNISGGRVGINIASPKEALHVNGNIRGSANGGALRIQTAGGYVDIGAQNSSWAHFYTDRSRFLFNKPVHIIGGEVSSYSTSNLKFSTNSVPRMTIQNSNGYVGIGTQTPAYPLHVVGDILNTGWMRTSGNTGLFFQDFGGGLHMTDATWIRTYGNKGFYHNTGIMRTDGEFQVGPGGDRFRVEAGGNVVTSGHVFSDKMITGRKGTAGTYNSSQVQGIWSIGDAYKINETNNTFGNQYGMVYAHTNSGQGISGWSHQIMYTNNGNMTSSISMTNGHAYFAGNLGLGTPAPTAKLDVNGTARIREITQNDASTRILTADVNGVIFWRDASTLGSGGSSGSIDGITSVNGNIGISNPNPLSKLHIKPDGGNLNTGIRIDNPWWNQSVYLSAFEDGVGLIGQNENKIATYEPSETGYSYHYADDKLWFNADGNAKFTGTVDATNFLINGSPISSGGSIDGITSLNGNIGINETNPQEVLHLNGKIRVQSIGEDYYLEIGGNVENLGLTHSHAGRIISSDDGGNIAIGQNNTARTVIQGKVGIGMLSNPNYGLNLSGQLRISDPAETSPLIVGISGAGQDPFWGVFTDNSSLIAMEYGGSSFTIANGTIGVNSATHVTRISGSVLINKSSQTNPSYKLDVNGDVNAPSYHMNSIVLTEDFVGDEQGLVDKTTNKFIAVKYVDGSYRFGSNGAGNSGIIVKNNNVLINKTSQVNSIYKLDVNGQVRANEIVVNTTGADFVFDKSYVLRSLDEVESFIEENNHLPEIPSAAHMQENGMAVGELNTKLLQKVEELTLYLIEMKKENEELKSRIEKIENK